MDYEAGKEMSDYSAIESELKTLLDSIEKFVTIETGQIRPDIPTSQMPALDISCFGEKYNPNDTDAQTKIPCGILIRRIGFNRPQNAREFKILCSRCIELLKGYKGVAFRVVRNIDADFQESDSGNGSIVRAGVIQITLWA